MTSPKFTILTLTFNRPHYLKTAVESVQAQTYSNWEMVIINNAATPETIEYLRELQPKEPRVKVVNFEKNQYDSNRPMIFMPICCNKALEVVSGEFILFLSDDDLIAPDYVEKMVRLFAENPKCISACGQAVSINGHGQVNENFVRVGKRPRFMPGYELVLDIYKGGRTLYSSPGSIFAIRTDARRKNGGYHEFFDTADFAALIPFGETGFDPSARFYWRHHADQLSKALTNQGHVHMKLTERLIGDFDLKQRWDAIEPGLGDHVCVHLRRTIQIAAASVFCSNLFRFNFKACGKILHQSAGYPHFWRAMPRLLIKHLPHLKTNLLKAAARSWFFFLPFTRSMSPALERIHQKAYR